MPHFLMLVPCHAMPCHAMPWPGRQMAWQDEAAAPAGCKHVPCPPHPCTCSTPTARRAHLAHHCHGDDVVDVEHPGALAALAAHAAARPEEQEVEGLGGCQLPDQRHKLLRCRGRGGWVEGRGDVVSECWGRQGAIFGRPEPASRACICSRPEGCSQAWACKLHTVAVHAGQAGTRPATGTVRQGRSPPNRAGMPACHTARRPTNSSRRTAISRV